MKVNIIKTQEFYSTMVEWWKVQNFGQVSPSMLPEYTFVCYNDKDIPVYSMCFYHTDSNLCWIGWQLANPEVKKEDKKGCFKYLFEQVEEHAKAWGYQIMFTTSNTPSVEATLKDCNYNIGDTNVNHYIKLI